MNAKSVRRIVFVFLLIVILAGVSACEPDDDYGYGVPRSPEDATRAAQWALTDTAGTQTARALVPTVTATQTSPPPSATSLVFPQSSVECKIGMDINDPANDVQETLLDVTRVTTKWEGEIVVVAILLQTLKIEFAPTDQYEWTVYIDADGNPETGSSGKRTKGAEFFASALFRPEVTKQASLTYWVMRSAGGSVFQPIVETDTPPDYTYKIDQEKKQIEFRLKMQEAIKDRISFFGNAINYATDEKDTFCVFENQ